MDALTSLVELLHPRTLLVGMLQASGRWGVTVPPQEGPSFYLVLEGSIFFRSAAQEALLLETGDFVLSSKPECDAFSSDPDVVPVLAGDDFKNSHSSDGILRLGEGRNTRLSRIMGGVVLCEAANIDLLTALLPPVIHVPSSSETAGRLHRLLEFAQDEASTVRPGRTAMLSRLVEMILIETLRRESERPFGPPGLLSGLQDQGIARALEAFHSDVAKGWTLNKLSRLARMSRSLFARRFHKIIGKPPLEYMIDWRMAIAKDALAHGSSTMEQVAERIGYRSASAFSAGFSKRFGYPPKDFSKGLSAQGKR